MAKAGLSQSMLNSKIQVFPSEAGAYFTVGDYGCFVEFGTGIVGYGSHEKADEVRYEYDVNNHGAFGWNWYNEKDGYLVKGFTGYEGKSFLWDAFFDYYSNGEFAKIYERIYRQIIGLS